MVVNIDEIEWEEWSHGDRYGSRSKHLGSAAGGRALGMVMLELSPGKQSSPLHLHTAEEEHIFLVEGEATLLHGEDCIHLSAGDYACFLPGTDQQAHALYNHSQEVCRFLVMGQRCKDDVVVYPEQNRVQVKALGKIYEGSEELSMD
ncbi:MAG: cupin domain-containing protein [Endozoicomonas sp.]